MKEPLVSVIINCFNGEEYLREAIDSVYSQTYKNWEIVFWDNASTDLSPSIAKSYDTKLKYFFGKSLLPLYEARNLALDKCKGEAIAFLDCDDIWRPNKLHEQVVLFNRGAKVVFGGYEVINNKGELQGKVINKRSLSTNSLLRKNSISIGCVMVDSKLIKKFKFDPSYNILGDFDLWVRLSLDYKFFSTGSILEFSRKHSKNTSLIFIDQLLIERRRFYTNFLKIANNVWYFWILYYILISELKGLKFMFSKKQ